MRLRSQNLVEVDGNGNVALGTVNRRWRRDQSGRGGGGGGGGIGGEIEVGEKTVGPSAGGTDSGYDRRGG